MNRNERKGLFRSDCVHILLAELPYSKQLFYTELFYNKDLNPLIESLTYISVIKLFIYDVRKARIYEGKEVKAKWNTVPGCVRRYNHVYRLRLFIHRSYRKHAFLDKCVRNNSRAINRGSVISDNYLYAGI